MTGRGFAIAIIIVILLAVGIFWLSSNTHQSPPTAPSVTATSTNPATIQSSDTQAMTLAGGVVSLSYPSEQFGLAVSGESLVAHSYIPPCDEGFDYCFFFDDMSSYAGTNFESAGIRVNHRPDLSTQTTCLTTEPTDYQGLVPATSTGSGYAVSVFSPLGDAAAGHFSNGALYRLFASSTCYEFQTRVGQSDFYNYPSGSIQQFTNADETAVFNSLQNILNNITLNPNGMPVVFPIATTTAP